MNDDPCITGPEVSGGGLTCAVSTPLRSLVLEQLMRACDDVTLLLPFVCSVRGSRAERACLGKLLKDVPLTLRAGSPLLVWLGVGEHVDAAWREHSPAGEHSVWQHLLFLELLFGPVTWPGREASEGAPTFDGPYQGWEHLFERSYAEADPTLG